MKNMQDFLEKLFVIEQKYNEQTENENINIFNILFYGHEEVTLHSRFISYLLSLKEHNFLETFVREILKIEEKNLIQIIAKLFQTNTTNRNMKKLTF